MVVDGFVSRIDRAELADVNGCPGPPGVLRPLQERLFDCRPVHINRRRLRRGKAPRAQVPSGRSRGRCRRCYPIVPRRRRTRWRRCCRPRTGRGAGPLRRIASTRPYVERPDRFAGLVRRLVQQVVARHPHVRPCSGPRSLPRGGPLGLGTGVVPRTAPGGWHCPNANAGFATRALRAGRLSKRYPYAAQAAMARSRWRNPSSFTTNGSASSSKCL